MMPQRNQEKDIATAASIWFEIWGSYIRAKKIRFLQANFRKISIFQAILQKNIEFYRQISKNFDFFRQLQKFDFPSKKLSFYSYLWANYSISLQNYHFRTYFLYMIRYNNISRPVHDSNDPLRPSLRPPCPKSGGRDPQPPGLSPNDNNGKEAFSRRKELPRGRLRRMKMPQEKNGENTDLKCDLVLCRNKDYKKGGHHKIGSL